MKRILCYILLMLIPTTSFTAQTSKKERPGYLRPRTVVYVYNPMEEGDFGHSLTEKFTVTSNKAELDVDAYYPYNNELIVLNGPTKTDKRGVTIAAEFNRNHGIKNGTTYIFTEVINLEGGGPVEFKQKLTGDIIGSDMEYGIAAPQFGIKETWYKDNNTEWHQIDIPHKNLGVYKISFRAYNSTLFTNTKGEKSVWGKLAQGTAVVTSTAILGVGAVGTFAGSQSNPQAPRTSPQTAPYGSSIFTPAEKAEQERLGGRLEDVNYILEKLDSRVQDSKYSLAQRNEMVELQRNLLNEKDEIEGKLGPTTTSQTDKKEKQSSTSTSKTSTTIKTGGAVLMAVAALSYLASFLPSYYPNILYKIEYIPSVESA
jgi:hypothetical protein